MQVRQLNNNGNIPTSGGEDDSRDETDKSGDTVLYKLIIQFII